MLFRWVIILGLGLGLGYFVGYPIAKVVKDELHSSKPFPRKIENLPYAAESVSFETEDGLKIAGSYAPSKNGATIVLIHGFGGSRKQLESLGKRLIDQGYGLLSYDTRAHGESEGSVTGYGDKEVLDLRAALDFLDARGVDRKRIGAYGFSIGAFTLARAAAHEERLRSIILASVPTSARDLAMDSDGGGVRGWVSGQVRMLVDEAIGTSAYGLEILDIMPYISPRPILILGGEQDPAVPPRRLREVFAAAKEPKALVIFEGAGHGDYQEKNKERFESLVLDHFQKTLLQ